MGVKASWRMGLCKPEGFLPCGCISAVTDETEGRVERGGSGLRIDAPVSNGNVRTQAGPAVALWGDDEVQ